jgi:hypothetical protein
MDASYSNLWDVGLITEKFYWMDVWKKKKGYLALNREITQ